MPGYGKQLTLPVLLRHDASFENYFGMANQKNVALLKRELQKRDETLIFIAGPADVGKTHLACAAIQYFENISGVACYFAMDELPKTEGSVVKSESVFDGLDHYGLVVLDNIDIWLNSGVREQALFNLFNRFKISGQQLLITARSAPSNLKLALADLSSRLRSGLSLSLMALDDDEKEEVLRKVAKQKGLVMAEEVSAYILKRGGRNMAELLSVVDTLDKASLVEQRKLTVPFVKKILHW